MTLQLNLQAPPKPFLAAGPIRLGLDLRNVGQAAASAPAAMGPTQFEFLLLTADGATTLQSYSQRKKELGSSRGLTPRLAPAAVSLAPGQVQLYRVDLADLSLVAIAPGKYLVEALLRLPGNQLIRSNKVPIEILAGRPVASVQGMDFRGARFNAYEFQPQPEGPLALRKWQSSSDAMGQGRFSPLPADLSSTEVTGLAMATEVEDADLGNWQWLAWVAGDQVQAAVTRAVDMKYSSGAMDSGLSAPRLVEQGFQYANGHGLFVLVGQGPEGRRLRLLHTPADPDSAPRFADLALAGVPAGMLGASYRIGNLGTPADAELGGADEGVVTGPADSSANDDDEDDEEGAATPSSSTASGRGGRHEILLTWLASGAAQCRFEVARVNPEDASLIAPPRLVLDSPRAVLAQAFPPVVSGGVAGAFAFLLAPSESGGSFTRLALDAHDLSRHTEWDLPPLDIPGIGPVEPDQWILAYGGADKPAAMAIFNQAMWIVRQGSGWRATGLTVATAASPIRLWCLPQGEHWSSWHDGVLGLQLHRVA